MKKLILSVIVLLLIAANVQSQTIIYKVTFADCIGLQLTSGDVCSAPFPPSPYIEEAKQASMGNQFGCSWMSTGTGTVSSINIELRFTINDQINISTILNSQANNGQGGAFENCAGSSSLMSWSVDPTNYNVGGGNSFLLDYAASSQINQIDHHSTDGIDNWYFIVTVDYVSCSAPSGSVTSFTNATCFGDTDGAIDISVSGGSTPYTFDWDNDGTGDFDDTEDLTGLSAGTYTVTVMEAGGCTFSFSQTITEPTALDVSVSQSGTTLTANATGVTYQWIDCAGPTAISGETGVSYTASFNGDYAVVITNGACSDTSVCTSMTNVGLSSYKEIDLFDVYPNPSSGKVFIHLKSTKKESEIKIIDMSGRLVKTIQSSLALDKTVEIDLSKLEKGVYHIVIDSDKGRDSQMITIK
jgi:Secretion system C-terminal sorting domain/SprB repeat